jgi:cytochrome c556
MKQRLIGLSALAAVAALSAPAHAQFAKAEDAIKYRQAAFTVMGTHMGRVGAMVQGKVPFDAKIAADNIAIAASVVKLPYVAFGEGTDLGNTKAKPEIWAEKAKFDAAAEKTQVAMGKLVEATKGGNFTADQLKAAFGPVGQSCKECHDTYKAK